MVEIMRMCKFLKLMEADVQDEIFLILNKHTMAHTVRVVYP